jgi:hypothetical protein
MEVFVGYTKLTSIDELGATLNAWDIEGFEPVAIQCTAAKYELFRRITAERLSTGDYILSDLGCHPMEDGFAESAQRTLDDNPDVGLVGVLREGANTKVNTLPFGVVICRKGVVDKWPDKKSLTYVQEHAKAYELKGYRSMICADLHYRRMEKAA